MDMEDEKELIVSDRMSIYQSIIKNIEEISGIKVLLHEINMNAREMTITISLDKDGK